MRVLLGGISPRDAEIRVALDGDTVFHAETAQECVESICACAPDILIVAAELPGMRAALETIASVLPVPVLVIAQGPASPCIPNGDIFGHLVHPVGRETLQVAMAIACQQFARLQGAREEAAQLRDAFATRKLIERAKGVIMQQRSMSEAEAYTYLREESRRKRTPLAEIARGLLQEGSESAPEPAVRRVRTVMHAPAPTSAPHPAPGTR